MVMPTQVQIEIPLLTELEKAGGKAKPQQLYVAVAKHFPQLTEDDLRRRKASGAIAWWNSVQWARQQLVENGEIDRSVHGVWAITEKGRQRLEGNVPDEEPSKNAGRRRRETIPQDLDHDGLARAMEGIGQAFGFDTRWKPKVNELRPDGVPFKSKRKTLDVAWQIGNLAWVPIEVQIAGSVADLIYRFQQVHQWSLRLIVVTSPSYHDEIKEAVRDYPFRDKLVILHANEVSKATKDLKLLLELRAKVFTS